MDIFYMVTISRMMYTVTVVWLVVTVPLGMIGFTWLILKTIAFDAVAIYSGFQNSQLDIDTRRAKLEAGKQRARLMLQEQRRMLQSGAPVTPLAEMWKAGVFDIEIEEAAK